MKVAVKSCMHKITFAVSYGKAKGFSKLIWILCDFCLTFELNLPHKNCTLLSFAPSVSIFHLFFPFSSPFLFGGLNPTDFFFSCEIKIVVSTYIQTRK